MVLYFVATTLYVHASVQPVSCLRMHLDAVGWHLPQMKCIEYATELLTRVQPVADSRSNFVCVWLLDSEAFDGKACQICKV